MVPISEMRVTCCGLCSIRDAESGPQFHVDPVLITSLFSDSQAPRGQVWQGAGMLKGFMLLPGTSSRYLWVGKN